VQVAFVHPPVCFFPTFVALTQYVEGSAEALAAAIALIVNAATRHTPIVLRRFLVPLLLVAWVEQARTRENTRAIVISDLLQDPRIRAGLRMNGVSVAVDETCP
jgi:hypothetical protein